MADPDASGAHKPVRGHGSAPSLASIDVSQLADLLPPPMPDGIPPPPPPRMSNVDELPPMPALPALPLNLPELAVPVAAVSISLPPVVGLPPALPPVPAPTSAAAAAAAPAVAASPVKPALSPASSSTAAPSAAMVAPRPTPASPSPASPTKPAAAAFASGTPSASSSSGSSTPARAASPPPNAILRTPAIPQLCAAKDDTALHKACCDGGALNEGPQLWKLIKQTGALNRQNKEGVTPLMYAASNNQPKIVTMLTTGNSGYPPVDGVGNIYPCSINVMDTRGYTALHHAAMQGHVECVRILLAQGASCSLKDKTGLTAVAHSRNEATRAAFPADKTPDSKIASPLSSPRGPAHPLSSPIASAAPPALALPTTTAIPAATAAPVASGPAPLLSGTPPISTENVLLRAACEGGKAYETRFLQMMKIHAAFVNKQDALGRSPLMCAAAFGHAAIMVMLATGKPADLIPAADSKLTDADGRDVLMYAIMYGQAECVKKMLRVGGNASHRDKAGRNAYEIAALTKSQPIIALLKKHREEEERRREEEEDNKRSEDNPVPFKEAFFTPQYCLPLRKYMEENLCAESFNYLWCAVAYKRLSTQEQREEFGPIVYNEFVVENAPQLVNIDSKTRAAVAEVYDKKEFPPELFDPATRMVFRMCDDDVYRRFCNTPQFTAMLEDPISNENLALRHNHRRRHSFSVVPMEDDYKLLTEIFERFSKSATVKERRVQIKLYSKAFKGKRLVDWLIEHHYAKSRPMGLAIGQRLFDALLIRPVLGFGEFEDSLDVTYTILPRPQLAGSPAAKSHFKKEGDVQIGWVLLKGVYYQRVFMVLQIATKTLYLYADDAAALPIRRVKLKKGGTYTLHFNERSEKQKKELEKNLPNIVEKSEQQALLKKLRSAMYNPMCYMNLDTEASALTFRLDMDAQDHLWWPAALVKCGVVEKKDEKKDVTTWTLRDMFFVPQYAVVFRKYMDENFLSEVFAFLWLTFAYKRLSTQEQRQHFGQILFDHFVSSRATQAIELDAKSKDALVAEFNKKEFKADLFEVVHKVVFQTADQGSFRRFTATPAFTRMLTDHQQVEAACLREQHRRTRDFPLVPMEENYAQLTEILTKLSRSPLPRDKKRQGKTYPQAFKGSKLVDWLLETDFARTRAEGVAIGQRLLDSQLIWELSDSADFEDSATNIYSITTKEGLEKTPGAKAQLKTDGEYHAGWVLLKGVYYHRTYLVVTVETHMLYMYTTAADKHARQAIPLTGAVFTLYYMDGREPDPKQTSATGMGMGPEVAPALLKDAAAQKKAAEAKAKAAAAAAKDSKTGAPAPSPTHAGSSGARSSTIGGIASSRPSKALEAKAEQPLVCILRVDAEKPVKRSWYFRLDVALEDDVSWPNALRSAGCQFRKPSELEPKPSQQLERFKAHSKSFANTKPVGAGAGPGAVAGAGTAAAGTAPAANF